MSNIREDKRQLGRQTNYVNAVVKDFDETIGTETNLFGETMEESVPERFDHIIQIGNLRKDRVRFGNPQDGRVYSMKGVCPTLNISSPPLFLIEDDGEYKIRYLSGIESLRLMGVEDEDIQKCVDGGITNYQMFQLAGNSIVVDIMSSFIPEMLKH
jgi:site-specific DNA-cytosine methylase